MPLLETEAPPLEEVEWLNSSPDIRSGTFLLSFLQPSCPGCRDSMERLDSLHRSSPVDVIGVHVPEFLERDAVEEMVEKNGVEHHVGHDPRGETAERYGPGEGVFLLDGGKVAWQKTPGNSFRELEQKILEATGEEVDTGLEGHREEQSDVYLGYGYGDVVNGGLNFRGEREFSAPQNRVFGRVYLDGSWKRGQKFLESRNGKLFLHQQSSRTSLVADAEGLKDVEVRMDGKPVPHSHAGDDLRVEQGRSYIRVGRKKVYSLLEGQRRKFEISLDPEAGTRMYRLSFG